MSHFDPLDMQTSDITQDNIEKIGKLFPAVITESQDEKGDIIKAIDFDLLRQHLSKDIVEWDDERYRLDRPGKRQSILKANTPITKTLRPVREESVDFDTTQNLYIEWDNFEVLKILQESYLGKVKMIYIDPPYNTGSDFVYKDNFKVSKDEYEEELDLVDEEWGRLIKNTDTNGRFHSDWLSMMYERLTVSRDLLRDDWVIFMSIDDNEIDNLRKISDEVFGEENFIANCIWQHSLQPKAYENRVSWHHNYTLIYKKSDKFTLWLFDRTDEDNKAYSNPDSDPKWLWRSGDVRSSYAYRENLMYDIISPTWEAIKAPEKWWRWSEDRVKEKIKTWEIIFNKNEDWIVRKIYLQDQWWRNPESILFWKKFWTTRGWNKLIKTLFGKLVFDTPKPVKLIKWLMKIWNLNNKDIILDFFSWSASTAHAIMELNAEDNWTRKHIQIQLPERTEEWSEANKAWYNFITEIWKERIRRAGQKILEEYKDEISKRETPLDIWFRVFKVDESNMKDVWYHPNDIEQKNLWMFENNIKDDRSPEDLLTQVMLDLSLELSLPIETKKLWWNEVFYVATNALVACFDEKIDFDIIDQIAELQPLKVVFRNGSFKDDKDRINVDNRFKRLSPETIISVI